MLSPKKMTGWGDEEQVPEVPRRLVGTWADTVLHQSGKKPQRGFGGRLIFYGKDNDKPVLIDGQLVVYAFDETNREPTDNKPTRRYVFPPDQVARRMSESEMGPSYSFWLPWDEVGGPRTEISLIARFEPVGGTIVIGEQTRHLLPGEMLATKVPGAEIPSKLPEGIPTRPAAPQLASLEERAKAIAAQRHIELASYDLPATVQAVAAEPSQIASPERRMTTTSISLPENFRMRGGVSTINSTLPVGNVVAVPQVPPASLQGVAAPISVPQATAISNALPALQPLQQIHTAYPTYKTPQHSQFGNGFVAPLGQPNFAPPATVGQIGPAPAAPIMPGQPPLTTASGWTTASYSPSVGQVAPVVQGATTHGPSSGSQQQKLLAPSTPAFR